MTIPVNNKEMSIQVTLNGFSFRLLTFDAVYGGRVLASGNFNGRDFRSDWRVAQGGFDYATVCWSTTNVMTIPAPLFDATQSMDYLAAMGMANDGVVPMYGVSGDVVVLWASDSDIASSIESVVAVSVNTHPLLKLLDSEQMCRECIKVYVDSDNVAHIAIWDYAGLMACESVQLSSHFDLLYFVRRFSSVDPFMVYRAELMGAISHNMEQLFASYYMSLKVLRINQL